jgi:hypothetical protein
LRKRGNATPRNLSNPDNNQKYICISRGTNPDCNMKPDCILGGTNPNRNQKHIFISGSKRREKDP